MTSWDASLYDGRHAYVFGYGREVVDMLDPRAGERVLDLGCGTGHLTNEIAARGAEVVGVDSSQEMIAQARAAYPALDFRIADARTMWFDAPFDAVFSNAALHWVHEADQAASCIGGALKPGGRFVAEFGGRGNVSVIQDGIRRALSEIGIDPSGIFPIWYFPAIHEYAQVLDSKGLEVVWAAMIPRDVVLDDPESGLRDWIRMFAGKALQVVPEQKVKDFLTAAETYCRVQLYRDGAWHADYRRIRVIARRAGE
ncbi:MAG: methyltransferase domain-containing protein [Candidatus Hydrogenedentes bacterium]|nr:methyltransferase domain-containing protein [Candidatus Hydrogenedentota bacterium]